MAALIVRRTPGLVAPATSADGTAVALSSPTANAFTDQGLTAVSNYSYAVFTPDTSGNTSAPVSYLQTTGAIAAGDNHTCAISAGGTVKCWGRNDAGALGDDTNIDRTKPVAVKDLSGVVALDAGEGHTCSAR